MYKDGEGHSGRWLGYVDSTKVIFSFRRKRKSISPDVRRYLSPLDLGIEKAVSVEIRFVSRSA